MLRRACDIGVALLGLGLLGPAMLALACWVRRDSPGPALYVPKMVGQGGRLFPLLRFRTMALDRPPQLGDAARLTRVGRVLRERSLDHLPMLVNLLLGHVTLVGPRPMEPARVDLADPAWREYFGVRPGLFNAAVLRLGRAWAPSQARRPELNRALEREYLRGRSARGDLALVLRSLGALVRSRGNIKARKPPDPDLRDRLGAG